MVDGEERFTEVGEQGKAVFLVAITIWDVTRVVTGWMQHK